MKKYTKISLVLPVLIIVLGFVLAGQLTAQTFTTLHSFSHNSAGRPAGTVNGGLILSGDTLYGTTYWGGGSDGGTVFRINTDGTAFITLFGFPSSSEGRHPQDGLVLSGDTLYGVASSGGSLGSGIVFKLNTNGTAFTPLHSFTAWDLATGTNGDGATPVAALVLSNNTLYGTTYAGGSFDNGSGLASGTVFAINTDATGFRTLHSFTSGDDGRGPRDRLILSENTLYGTAAGGSSGNGTVFAANTNGTGFMNLPDFSAGDGVRGGLVLSGNTFYGTSTGGVNGAGTVFAVNTDGSAFNVLYSFTAASGTPLTNTDGTQPSRLILSGNTLYGTASGGGNSGNGTVFAVNTDGSGFKTLYSFTAGSGSYPNITNSDGAYPNPGLVLSRNTLYGTAWYGGSSANGTVFSISLGAVNPPQLTITPVGANAVLTWPSNATSFNLQSTTNLGPSAIWTTNLPAPAVANGLNTVTNPLSGTQQFFRLSQ